MADIVLLGGSNSVLKDEDLQTQALKEGFESLQKSNNVLELALGATTSLQNLCQVVKYGEVFEDYDFVVSESNANDIHAHNHGGLSLEHTLLQIDAYYEVLSQYASRVLVLILATELAPTFRNVEQINQRHIDNCQKYGFKHFDMQSLVTKYRDDFPVQHDDLHPNRQLMLNLWGNIIQLNRIDFPNILKKQPYDWRYQYVRVENLLIGGEGLFVKNNSKFKESLLKVSSKTKISDEFIGWELLGVATWSDSLSKMSMSNQSKRIIKGFNEFNSFNELRESFFIDGDTYIDCCNDLERVTEPSLNVPREFTSLSDTNLAGFLLRKIDVAYKNEVADFSGGNILNFISEEFTSSLYSPVTFESIRSLIEVGNYDQAIQMSVRLKSEELTNYMRDVSVEIENEDLKGAYQLMKCAHERRPEGPYIKKKYDEMRMRLIG